ncbi:SDR family oxidoreductase [Bacillus tianshenii]|nr:SDR family oxidoreductase [Bacillus tianshenii]
MNIFSNQALMNQHILITGATGGIGKATAIAAAQAGSSVTVTGRNKAKLADLAQQLNKTFPNITVTPLSADLTNKQERDSLVEDAVKHNGLITGLVNSAGIAGGTVLERLTEEDIRRIMELNYTATILLTQRVYEEMKKTEKGAIVNVSSLSGLRGTYGNSAYAASKFALIGFTQSFALEAIRSNIRVNAVCPGFVETEMGIAAIKRKAEREGRSFEEQWEKVHETMPSGRITKPEEVANTIIYLLSEAAENIVGESVKLSGGSVMR